MYRNNFPIVSINRLHVSRKSNSAYFIKTGGGRPKTYETVRLWGRGLKKNVRTFFMRKMNCFILQMFDKIQYKDKFFILILIKIKIMKITITCQIISKISFISFY
jgi:hypothetical protein